MTRFSLVTWADNLMRRTN